MELRAGPWPCEPLSQHAEFITKGATPTTYGFDWTRDGVCFLRSECVAEHGLDLSQSMFVSHEAFRALGRGAVRSGDLLMTITGNVGRVVRLHEDFAPALINQHIARIRVRGRSLDAAFLRHWLAQPEVRTHYNSITTGQAYPQISLRQVRDTLVPLPDLREQRAIASALDDVDALASAQEQVVAKKRDVKQAAMQRLLTGEQRLPEFRDAWRRYPLATLFDLLRTANNARADLTTGGDVGYVHYGDIHKSTVAFLDCSSPTLPTIETAKVVGVPRLMDGDLIMADASEDYAGVGKAVEVHSAAGRPVVAGLHTMLLRPDPALVARGFSGYLQSIPSVRQFLERAATGISVYGISKSVVRAVEVELPELDEQRAIAAVLADMDAELAALGQRLTKTRALKQAMMQELLTGRTRLAA